MHVAIIFPALPPALDGIGDHTAHLAAALSAYANVRVLTAQEDPLPIPGVTIETAFSLDHRRGIRGLLPVIEQRPPDWLLLQFNQFSYGRWGLNLHLPRVLHQIRKQWPKTRIAWLAHEDFLPRTSWKFTLMSTWQRLQFRQLGQASNLILFTIDYWVETYRGWFPETPIACIPVGSNIPLVNITRDEARRLLRFGKNVFVVGYFGSLHNSRLPHLVRAAAERLYSHCPHMIVLYVGADGNRLRAALGDVPLYDAGPLPAHDVSAHLAAMDLYLAPFMDGVSTRRGSFMASLQHGIATVATRGHHTGEVLRAADEKALLLSDCDDIDGFVYQAERLFRAPRLRASVGAAGQQLYQTHFDWPVLAERLACLMQLCEQETASISDRPPTLATHSPF